MTTEAPPGELRLTEGLGPLDASADMPPATFKLRTTGSDALAWCAGDMRAYAAAAVAAEREACARLAESFDCGTEDGEYIAAAIRAREL